MAELWEQVQALAKFRCPECKRGCTPTGLKESATCRDCGVLMYEDSKGIKWYSGNKFHNWRQVKP